MSAPYNSTSDAFNTLTPDDARRILALPDPCGGPEPLATGDELRKRISERREAEDVLWGEYPPSMTLAQAGLAAPPEAWYRDFCAAYPRSLIEFLVEFHEIPRHLTPTVEREYPCEAGRVDLLVRFTGASIRDLVVVVCEFKRNVADEGAVAQALRYVGCIKAEARKTIPPETPIDERVPLPEPIRVLAVVCAPSFTKGAEWAASAANVTTVSIRAAIRMEFGG